MSAAGNTSRVQKRGQSITWTLNNYTEEDIAGIKRDWPTYAKYVCFGKEVGANGTPHLQGWISLQKQTAYTTIHSYAGFARAYFVNSKGNALDNKNYCSKGDMAHEEYIRYRKGGDRFGQDVRSHPDFGRNANFWESGPLEVALHQGKSNKLVEFLEEINNGKTITEVLSQNVDQQATYVRNYRGIDKISDMLTRGRSAADGFPEIHWIFGSTGLHKSKSATDFARRYCGCDDTVSDDDVIAFIGAPEPGTKKIWFDEFRHQPVAVLDDIRAGSHPFVWMLSILDRYGRSVDIKCGRRKWNPEVIFLTAADSPRNTYCGRTDEQIDQMLRRIVESGGAVWSYPEDREKFYAKFARLLPRGTESRLSDPRRRPQYEALDDSKTVVTRSGVSTEARACNVLSPSLFEFGGTEFTDIGRIMATTNSDPTEARERDYDCDISDSDECSYRMLSDEEVSICD